MAIHPNASKEIDRYFASVPEFARPICRKLREIIHTAEPEVVEDWKWGPNFNKQGMICGVGSAKAFVKLTFFKGALLKDGKKILEDCSGSSAHNRSLRFMSLDDINEKVLIAYVKEAVQLNERGIKAERTRAPLAMPADLKEALAANSKARKSFESFTPGCQREYIEWVVGAKRPETRSARIQTTLEQSGEGKSLHWKYKK